MPDETPQDRPAPILKETRYANANMTVSDADQDGTRELSFVTGYSLQGTPELNTFILTAEAQKFLAERFSGGITIAQPGDVPKPPPDLE